MIDKLNIENFMTFKKLEIPTLRRVNLIGGKNNSGKTTLLDAIRILASGGDSSVINNILFMRGSFRKNTSDSYLELYNESVKPLPLSVFSINNIVIKKNETYKLKYFREKNAYEKMVAINLAAPPDDPNDKLTYIPFQPNFDKLSELWDKIVLTPKEDDVHDILRETVEPKLIRFDVGRTVRVRLKGLEQPVPIATLGDGVQRILLTALSLANASNSILLIDEIEAGLHYSVLEKLWQMIFKYAQEWNIQVFATTHSQDAIKTFHYVASDEKYIDDAEYIRLQVSRQGKNEAIIFDGERLKNSLDLKLEIR